jgi:uncharacterized protein YacL
MTLLSLRVFFLILCVMGSWSIGQLDEHWALHPVIAVLIGLTGGGAMIGLDLLLKGFSLRGLSAATFGLFVGFLMSFFIDRSGMFDKIAPDTLLIARISMYVIFSYLAMVIALRGKDEFNLVIPYVKFVRENKPDRLVLLDTNIIIDGRIQDVCAAGFLDAVFVVPRFVLRELQYIADAPDAVKNVRGKRGLEVLRAMQKNPNLEIKIHDNEVPEIKEVDGKLVHLAKALPAEIVTNDVNLARVAELQHIRVLNLHELAKALRPVILPGEKLAVKLVKEGRESDQALAYLDDGTMIVVNHARRQIGKDVQVAIQSVLQTGAGRMAFAELMPAAEAAPGVKAT